ncbi:hypothetical protein [Dyella sp. C11]|uniref:hypothetical protein n=1 Tax=Dyella sp. C11 TaxID=2126991 RepID=UPI000D641308|nr:hypothetical protein [Dyella sp. C11]
MKNLFATAMLLAAGLAGAAHAATPSGWFMYVNGAPSSDFDTGTESSTRTSGATSAFLRAKADSAGFATLMQTIDASTYQGKRVRLSGYLRTKDAGKGQLWMRVDGADRKSVAFDNMDDRAPQGDKTWQHFDVVLDVPEQARDIAFGLLLQNKGEVWADGLAFDVVDKTVPTTGKQPHTLPAAPVNMDFSR